MGKAPLIVMKYHAELFGFFGGVIILLPYMCILNDSWKLRESSINRELLHTL